MMGDYFYGGWMIIVWIIVVALIIWGVIVLVRYLSRNSDTGKGQKPLDIARERYARGEITREEFENIKKDLRE